MLNNEDKNDSETSDTPQDSLFKINSNYNSLELNKMIKSSTNIFTHFSPLFAQTMTSFTKGKNILFFNSKSKKNIFLNNFKTFLNIKNQKYFILFKIMKIFQNIKSQKYLILLIIIKI